MIQTEARIVDINETYIPGLEKPNGRSIESSLTVILDCPEIAAEARPGQFVMVNCGQSTLPRPFSINRVTNNGEITLFISVLENGIGTEWLSKRKPGDMVKLLGPLGNGFTIDETSHNIFLVGGGMGLDPLVFLAEEAVSKGILVTLMYGTQNKYRYPVERVLSGVSIVSATEDGSIGHHGMVTELIPEYINTADQVFICGPLAMYKYLHHQKLMKDKSIQVSLEVRMACGRGLCYGCTIQTINGKRRVCEDGPVFDFNNIDWDSI
ncbi:MAG: dihydroorotate dehydrogenase electron transfer subunit [Dehalococcoidales bacterium]|nr:MAG: dihydroorotate dehydrogenase electron transfer subunit [Dehalococcoidales bacterium]